MKRLSRYGKINLALGFVMFLAGIYLLFIEINEGTFEFIRSRGIAFTFIGIGLAFAALTYEKKSNT
ncbi:hypothetical protein [Thalassobacillus hwangdonensis]|uniref:Uncharacterized protein n=1 Tax=Thalassobacillus hwangdonensis TaxID=546108 RepID=A0ABW3L044_9BACI